MDFSKRKELSPYMSEPRSIPVGTVGKMGFLHLGFELDDEGKSILRHLERHVPLIVQQELYFDEAMPEMPCVYILSSGGPNVDGDRYEQKFILAENSYAHITTGAATKLAEMNYNYSALEQTIELADNAYLEYIPEPIIPCKKTRFISDTDIKIAHTATLFYSEIYMGGRKYYNTGELFEYDLLSVCAHAERFDGQKLFREKFIIRPKDFHPSRIGIMHQFDVFANVLLLTPKNIADAIYNQIDVFINRDDLAVGVTHLPNESGLLIKVLGKETEPVKRIIRAFCSLVRLEVKGKPLPDEFPWR